MKIRNTLTLPAALSAVGLLFVDAVAVPDDTTPPEPAGAEAEAEGGDTALGVRQQRIKRMIVDLERQFTELARALQKESPEEAERLVEAFKKSKEMLLEKRMDEITAMLNLSKLDTAGEEQGRTIEDVKALIELLLRDDEEDRLKKEIEKLERWKKALDELIVQETKLKEESDIHDDKDKALARLDKQIEELEGIIEKQSDLKKKTEDETAKGIDGLDALAEEQEKLRAETEELQKKVEAGPDAESESEGEGEGKPQEGEGKPQEGEGKPQEGEGKPQEGGGKPQEGEGKPQEGGGKPQEGGGKPQEGGGKPQEGGGKPQEGGGKPQEGGGKPQQGGGDQPPQPERPGAEALKNATEDQKGAEKRLAEGKGKQAGESEDKALDDLGKALDELKKERDRIAGLTPEEMDGLAQQQNNTAGDTGKLAEEMGESGAEGQPSDPGQQQDPLREGQERARKAVEDAKGKMDKASGKLAGGNAGGASQSQGGALDDLERARQEVQDQLDELVQEQQMEALVQLEQLFREMLDKQKKASASTLAVDEKRGAQEGKLRRADRIQLRTVEVAERELVDKAQEAEGLIVDEGTSVVVRNVVEGMRNDLTAIADMLDGQQTGEFVQRSQKEVELTLEELIEAVKLAQQMLDQQMQQQQPPQPGQQQKPGLLPPSAELKLLKLTQLRINRRTVDFDNELNRVDQVGEVLARQILDAEILQKKVTESAQELAARGKPPVEAEID